MRVWRLCLLGVLMVYSFSSRSQTVTAWSEDFSLFNDGAVTAKWAITPGQTGYFQVESNQLVAKDNDTEGYWESEIIEIRDFVDIQASMNISEGGNNRSTDYIRVEYSLNGAAYVQFETAGYANGNFNSITPVTNTIASGTTLRIRVISRTSHVNKIHNIDNIVVSATPKTQTPGLLNGFGYYKNITVNNNNVGSGGEELVNFPVFIDITDTDLRDNATSPVGNDIVFTDATGTKQLYHEIEHFNLATGELVAWVRMPVITAGASTTIRMYYGYNGYGSTVSNNTWNSNYISVWHLGDIADGDTPYHADATGNGFISTAMGGPPVSVSKIHKGQEYDGTAPSFFSSFAFNITNQNNITVSAWVETDVVAGSDRLIGGQFGGYGLGINTSGQFTFNTVGATQGSATNTNWHYVVAVQDAYRSDGQTRLYVDGNPVSTVLSTQGSSAGNFSLGYLFDGILDEVRVSEVVRSANWITVEHASHDDPSTFLNFGPQINPNGSLGNVLWLRGDAGTTDNPVSEWADQSGQGNNATQVNQDSKPGLVSNSSNFNASLNFDGSNDQMTLLRPVSDDYTVFLVVKPLASGPAGTSWWQGNGIFDGEIASVTDDFGGISLVGNKLALGVGKTDVTLLSNEDVYSAGNNYPHIAVATREQSTGTISISIDANTPTSRSDASTATLDDIAQMRIGSLFSNNNYYNGHIFEIMVHDEDFTSNAQKIQDVESYLAIKYGLTLAQDYTIDGTTYWNTTAGFDNNIAGIGQDNTYALVQPRSKSEMPGALITMNAASTSDQALLMWANDNGGVTGWGTAELPSTGVDQRISREWMVQENSGDAGTVTLSVDQTDLPAVTGSIVLLVDGDGDFSSGASIIPMTENAGTWSADHNFSDGEYFTIGLLVPDPTGKALWYKANDGVNETGGDVSSWIDRSGNNIPAVAGAFASPVLENEAINFNEAVRFDGVLDYLEGASGFYINDYFIVFKPDNTISSALNPGQGLLIGEGTTGDPVSDLTGVALGYVTGAYNDEVITHGYGAVDTYREAITGSVTYPPAPYIFNAKDTAGVSPEGSELYMNGLFVVSERVGTNNITAIDNQTFDIGQFRDDALRYSGLIAEIIVFRQRQSDAYRRKIASYLAIKYGVTLDQSSTIVADKTYITTGDIVVWDPAVTGSYNHDIAGVGKDDGSPLDQPKSKSENDDAIIVMEDAATENERFLLWSNNNGNKDTWTANEAPAGYKRFEREWLIEENNGDVGEITLSVNATDLPATGNDVVLLIDSDGDFSSGASEVTMSNTSGAWTAEYNFQDGDYFTFGYIAYDFGDAPDPAYPTLLANNGARHRLDGSYLLGAAIDDEDDGQPSVDAGGDGADDDGISFATPVEGGTTETINVTVTTTGGYLNGWIDYNDDGDWDDAEEYFIVNEPITSVSQNINFDVPCDILSNTTIARFRYSSFDTITAGGYRGELVNGEVEDYEVILAANTNPPVFTTFNGSVCSLETGVQYAVTDMPGATYSWSVTGGTITSATNQREITVNWNHSDQSPGQINCDITVPYGTGKTCIYNLSGAVVINAAPDVETKNNTAICAGNSTDLWINDLDYSLKFDGINGKVEMPDDPIINTGSAYPERTISVWFKVIDKDLATKQVIYEEGGGGNGFAIYIQSGTLYIIGWRSNALWGPIANISTSAISNDTWHNAALSYYYGAGTDYFRTYLDGNRIGEVTPPNELRNHQGDISFGFSDGARYHDNSTSNSPGFYFGGWIDEFKLWNDALSDAEIAQYINSTNIDGKLDVYYNFNENTGTTITDQVGTINGAITASVVTWDGDNPIQPVVTWNDGTGDIGTGDTITVTPNATTTYIVSVDHGSGGCDATGSVTVTVNDIDVTLATDDGEINYCVNEQVNFTATPAPSTPGIIYTFRVNGAQVQQGTGNTYSTTGLTDGDRVTVDVEDTNGCTATSNELTMQMHENIGTNPIRIIR